MFARKVGLSFADMGTYTIAIDNKICVNFMNIALEVQLLNLPSDAGNNNKHLALRLAVWDDAAAHFTLVSLKDKKLSY